MIPRPFWVLLGTSTGLAVADMLFTAVNTMISPTAKADAPWQSQALSAVWVTSILLALLAGASLLRRKRRSR